MMKYKIKEGRPWEGFGSFLFYFIFIYYNCKVDGTVSNIGDFRKVPISLEYPV